MTPIGAVDAFARRHRYHLLETLPWLAAVASYFAFPDYLALGAQILATILFALSADLVLGYAGIVTLGHAAFFGTGAYIAGILAALNGNSTDRTHRFCNQHIEDACSDRMQLRVQWVCQTCLQTSATRRNVQRHRTSKEPPWVDIPQDQRGIGGLQADQEFAAAIRAHGRVVQVTTRIVYGTTVQVEAALRASPVSRMINTYGVERNNLTIRQHARRMGRKVNAFSQDPDYLEHQLTLAFAYYHFVVPHRGLRQRLACPLPTKGNKGSYKKWKSVTPAMAAGLTDHVWTMDELLSFRVPPKSRWL